MFVRKILVLALCIGAFGCAREDARLAAGDAAPASAPVGAHALPGEAGAGMAAMAGTATTRGAPGALGFASLPDRGELVSYRKDAVRAGGAYTWYRADVSEAHALAAIASGHLRVPTPDGKLLDFKYDRHVEHASGDWTWIGHLVGNAAVQTVLTFGAEAAFGSIGQPDQRPLRMTMRDGQSWLVATDAAKLAKVIGRYTAEPDYLIVPAPGRTSGTTGRVRASALAARTQQANAAGTVIDVLVGYSPGMVEAYGSQSKVLTRINFLVDYTNQAYANSDDSTSRLGRVRLVGTMQVNYRDDEDNTDTLHKLSGYDSNTGKEITPDPAFSPLRAARETLGADLVSFVHDFRTPENDSCGVAWLLGGGKQGIDPNAGWDYLGYSVVSDGSDVDESDSGNYFCEDHTFAHELGHNMGLAHDRKTSQGDDGVLDNPDDYGVSDYSFGYKRSSFSGGLYTVMAYGDPGQTSYNIFSNPRKTSCGNAPCGIAKGQPDAADASLSLSETMPLIAAFRASVVPGGSSVRSDYDGDGRSDILWRNYGSGANAIWRSGNVATSQAVASVAVAWRIVGSGDFDGDGRADILWRNSSTGANAIWKSGNAATSQAVSGVSDLAWGVAGVGDFNADGRADILWRNTRTGANVIWRSGDFATRTAVATLATSWRAAGVGDFNGDGNADILWRHATTGANAIWRSGDVNASLAVTGVSNLAWNIAAVDDFDGDGKADILWRNGSTGSNTIWRSASSASAQSVASVATSWTVAAAGDYDGDGKADILWRNAGSGANAIWKSANLATSQSVASVSRPWTVAP